MAGSDASTTAARPGTGLLGIYLNDHLAGATAGLIARADRQVEELENLRVRTAATLFGAAPPGTGQDVPGTR